MTKRDELNADWIKWRSRDADIAAGEVVSSALAGPTKSAKYSEDQERDESGRWTSGGGDAGGGDAGGREYRGSANQSALAAFDPDDPSTHDAYLKSLAEVYPGSGVALTDAQAEVFGQYHFGEYYKTLNSELRSGEVSVEARTMDKIFTKVGTSTEDVAVYRGIKGDLSKLEVGSTLVDKGFVSTTFDRDTATAWAGSKGGWVVEIQVPAGNQGIAVDRTLIRTGELELDISEHELVLPRDLPMEVLSTDPGSRTMVVRVVTP